jgi:hypothetical protein
MWDNLPDILRRTCRAQRSHIRPLYVQHLIVADNSEEQRLAKLLGEEIGRREKVICTFREDMEKLHMECTIYKNQVNKLKQELDDERTKYELTLNLS